MKSSAWRVACAAATVTVTLGLCARAEEGGAQGPKPQRASGEIVSADASSVTIKVRQGKEGAATEVSRTFTINGETKILVEGDGTEQVAGEGGTTKTRTKMEPGTGADLKAGWRATVSELNGVAVSVTAHKPRAPKVGGEGGMGVSTPRPPRIGGEGERERGVSAPKPPRTGGEGER